ncbi:MAG: rhodanese-like domain-containing protein [Planctomycetaceae bacterium]
MTIPQLTPDASHQTLTSDETAVYLDVRTEAEFDDGHPNGAWNLPIAFADPDGQMIMNPDFLEVARHVLPQDRFVICGCKSGGRSQAAAEYLLAAGYDRVANVTGGFLGAPDPTGLGRTPGWLEQDLPVSNTVDHERSHSGLRQRAGL